MRLWRWNRSTEVTVDDLLLASLAIMIAVAIATATRSVRIDNEIMIQKPNEPTKELDCDWFSSLDWLALDDCWLVDVVVDHCILVDGDDVVEGGEGWLIVVVDDCVLVITLLMYWLKSISNTHLLPKH